MTHESAKQRYKDTLKLRGSDPESLRRLSEERLQAAKARSYCAGCRRRGHWHRDAVCPLNKSGGASTAATAPTSTGTTTGAGARSGGAPSSTKGDGVKQHVVHVTWDIHDQAGSDLVAITDTACSRSVAGIHWINSYVALVKQRGYGVNFVPIQEAFRFGASRVFEARHAAVIYFEMGDKVVGLKVAVVYGEVPLLISRPALGELGMIMDVAKNVATFRALGVTDLPLQMTETGHPAFPVSPVDPKDFEKKSVDWQAREIEVFPRSQQYMVFALHAVENDSSESQVPLSTGPETNPAALQPRRIFYPKRIAAATKNLLLGDIMCRESFLAWWSQTTVSNDFWLEGEHIMVRVHVVPRRTFFNPASWSTPKHELKENLLQNLGHMRVVNAISCQSRREFPAVQDLWENIGADSSFPMLWIGRTVFCRASMPCRSLCDPPALHGSEVADRTGSPAAQDDMGNAQGRATSGSGCEEPASEPPLDRSGAEVRDPGRSSRGRSRCDEQHAPGRTFEDDAPGVEGQSRGDRARGAGQGEQRTSDEDDQRPRRPRRGDPPDLREVQWDAVHGHPDRLPHLGSPRGGKQRQCFRGAANVRHLVDDGNREERCGSSEALPRPGTRGIDPLRPGGQRFDDLGAGVLKNHYDDTAQEQGLPCSATLHDGGAEGPTLGIKLREPCPDGTGRTRGDRRSPTPGGASGNPTRSSWTATERNDTARGPEPVSQYVDEEANSEDAPTDVIAYNFVKGH